jgi:hypothetical protein
MERDEIPKIIFYFVFDNRKTDDEIKASGMNLAKNGERDDHDPAPHR